MTSGWILLLALQATAAPAAPPAADPAKPICRTENQTGSRVASTRRCKTAAEWAAEAEERRAVYLWQREQSRSVTR